MDKTSDDRPSLERIMEKLSYLDNRIEGHFGGLKSDILILRHKPKDEIEGVKSTLTRVEKFVQCSLFIVYLRMAAYECGQIAGGTCGSSVDNPANVKSIILAKCKKAIQAHLHSCSIQDTSLDSEPKPLWARAGM